MSRLVVSKVFLSAQVLRFFLFLPMPFPLQRHSCWPSSTPSWAQILGATVWLPPHWENHRAIPTKQGRSKPEQLPPRPHQIPFSALTAADWLQHLPNSGGHWPPGRWRDLPGAGNGRHQRKDQDWPGSPAGTFHSNNSYQTIRKKDWRENEARCIVCVRLSLQRKPGSKLQMSPVIKSAQQKRESRALIHCLK